ncbi:hypothetical protein AVEN_251345-1 [Araneus ventricosus]|uniref:Uncharacterized protein n=1 Tax=Araneus ventricosus TaxID=182803 RepID=A0A4Y2KAE7_ARAVE|nr:hypothetical protein AVEN_251345-1 [Araneus ventricosus]
MHEHTSFNLYVVLCQSLERRINGTTLPSVFNILCLKPTFIACVITGFETKTAVVNNSDATTLRNQLPQKTEIHDKPEDEWGECNPISRDRLKTF